MMKACGTAPTDRGDIWSLEAWRESPIGRRVVELTSQYVVGTGFDIQCDHDSHGHFWISFGRIG